MKIQSDVFYQPLINQELFAVVTDRESSQETLQSQSQVLSYLDTIVVQVVLEYISDEKLQKQFLTSIKLEDRQEDLLAWIAEQNSDLLAIIQEKLDRALLDLHSSQI